MNVILGNVMLFTYIMENVQYAASLTGQPCEKMYSNMVKYIKYAGSNTTTNTVLFKNTNTPPVVDSDHFHPIYAIFGCTSHEMCSNHTVLTGANMPEECLKLHFRNK